jgi:bis(5'-nucleosidyl)-tetraphosphatase
MKKDFSYGIIPLKYENGNWLVFVIKHHSGHWSFPKGHKEDQENDLEAATRELFEETGLKVKNLLPFEPLIETYTFYENTNKIEKTVTYFVAETEGSIHLQEEELQDGRWIDFNDAEMLLTYSEAKKILRQVNHLIN